MITQDKLDEFIQCYIDITQKRFGPNPQSSDSYGRIINEQSFDTLERRLKMVNPSKLLMGGEIDKKDRYMSPTLIGPLGADETELMTEEIFGKWFYTCKKKEKMTHFEYERSNSSYCCGRRHERSYPCC